MRRSSYRIDLTKELESHARLNLECPWRDEVRPAKGREEVIESDLVGDIGGREPQGQFLVLSAEQVVGADTKVEEIPRRNAWRISVVVLLTIGRYAHAQRTAIG